MFPIGDVNPTRITPLITYLVIALNVAVFFGWQPLQDPVAETEFLYRRAAIACELTTGEPLSLAEITTGRCDGAASSRVPFPAKQISLSVLVSMFLHGGLLHLAGNMWFLWIFGNNVEEAFGRIRYAALYLAAGIVATLGFVLMHPASTTPLIGASGAIAGVLGAYLVLYPRHLVMSVVFFTLIPVPAFLFLGLWFLGQFAVSEPGVAWEAHVAGFLLGAAVAMTARAALLRRVARVHRGLR